jgi:hypothetical protein
VVQTVCVLALCSFLCIQARVLTLAWLAALGWLLAEVAVTKGLPLQEYALEWRDRLCAEACRLQQAASFSDFNNDR